MDMIIVVLIDVFTQLISVLSWFLYSLFVHTLKKIIIIIIIKPLAIQRIIVCYQEWGKINFKD
jgi:hypothetical protein